MSLLIMENVFKEYRNKTVLEDVSLRIERGERVALTGPNGCGKSTLIKIALGIENCDKGSAVISKSIKVGYISQDMAETLNRNQEVSNNALHYDKIAVMERKLRDMEKQLEYANEGEGTGYENLMSDYTKLLNRYEAMDGYTIESRIKKTLMGLGLREEALVIPVEKLSGGERMRVAIARAILEEPDLMILDEPTNHLDIGAIEWLEDFLKKFDGGVLFVSHDRYFLDQVATRVAELENGKITIRGGNYTTFIEQKSKMRDFMLREQKRLSINIREANKIVQQLKGMGKHTAWKSREIALNKMKSELSGTIAHMKDKEHLYKTSAPKIEFKKLKHTSKDIAWGEKLCKSFGDVNIFKNADFHISGGERTGIIGPNGCGKTTLLNILLGKDREYTGFARLGEWVKYSYISQEIYFEDEGRTVLEEILNKKEMTEPEARDLLSRFQFYGEEVEKNIRVLSGGERVRLFLACVILENNDCLIMDEPTNHLDVASRDAMERALKEFRGTVIAITHDRYFLNNCVTRILEIDDGKINSYNGNYDFYKSEKQRERDIIVEAKTEKNTVEKQVRSEEKKAKENDRKKAQKLQELEMSIFELEKKLKELEDSFDESTPYEKYSEHQELAKSIADLYKEWESAAE